MDPGACAAATVVLSRIAVGRLSSVPIRLDIGTCNIRRGFEDGETPDLADGRLIEVIR